MISYLQIENLTKSVGDRMLFADVTFGIYEGDKIGLIAPNGAGKSTMLRIIAGRESADSGEIVARTGLRIELLEQEPQFDPERTLLESVAPPPHDGDDWDAPDRARRMLTQLGIADPDRIPSTYSGGQLKRAAIARVLLREPDLLLLDEPTNHLDIEIVEWLEAYLTRQRITLLMVTHDRYFLDNVCSKIIEIDRSATYTYEGNYDYYLRRREERMEAMTAELARVNNLLRTEREWMRRQPQARGSKAKYRIDNFHDLERRSRTDLRTDQVRLRMQSGYIGSKIFEARGVSKAFGDKKILSDWSYDFARFDKVGIVGPNGVGKTTFLRMLLGELPPDSGTIDVGETVRWGYYSQHGLTNFDEQKKVIDAVREIAEEVRLDDRTTLSASQFLTQFLFSPEAQQKYIYKLSGGERRRLNLAVVLMRQPNFLVLDEPTNDLDILTLTILEDYLARFRGCVIVVSHDRFFLDRVAEHLFVFEGDGRVSDFPGSYSNYRHCVAEREKERRAQASEATADRAESRPRVREPKKGLTFKEKREREELESELVSLESERAELETALSGGEMDVDEITRAGSRVAAVAARIDDIEMRLLELMEKES